MLKILHVAPVSFDPPFGVSVYVSSLLNAVVRLDGVQVGILTHLPDASLMGIDKKIVCLPLLEKKHLNPWKIDAKYAQSIFNLFGRPDLVHFHGVYYPFQTAFASYVRKQKVPYIVSTHGGFHPCAQQRKGLKKAFGNILFFNKFINGALAVHALNNAEATDIKKRFPKKEVFIIPNGISDLSKPPKGSFVKTGTLTFGFIGRIDIKNKGIDLLMKAVSKVQKNELIGRFRLIFAGYFCTKNDERLFCSLVKNLPNPDSVEFRGIVQGDKKDKTFVSFDIFVLTSRHEGMPGTVLEAMIQGIPCLVTPGTNIAEMVTECNGGWVCEANPNAIAEQIIQIAANRFEILQRGANAYEYVRKHLTWDKIASEYIQQIKCRVI
ncbi:MAG: glycosyltransferase [Candidatus Omnitrophota bacterium]|jgi:glycosyltransferase involved in cell wall biosynthesis